RLRSAGETTRTAEEARSLNVAPSATLASNHSNGRQRPRKAESAEHEGAVMSDEDNREKLNQDAEMWSRRGALGALAAGAVTLVGCGDGSEAGGSAGQPGSGGVGGGAGGSGGSAGAGASGGGAGQSGSGGSAGQAGAGGGQGGAAGASSLECKQTGPTPGCKITEDNILGPFYKAGA